VGEITGTGRPGRFRGRDVGLPRGRRASGESRCSGFCGVGAQAERRVRLPFAPGGNETCSPPISYPWWLAGAGTGDPGGVKPAGRAWRPVIGGRHARGGRRWKKDVPPGAGNRQAGIRHAARPGRGMAASMGRRGTPRSIPHRRASSEARDTPMRRPSPQHRRPCSTPDSLAREKQRRCRDTADASSDMTSFAETGILGHPSAAAGLTQQTVFGRAWRKANAVLASRPCVPPHQARSPLPPSGSPGRGAERCRAPSPRGSGRRALPRAQVDDGGTPYEGR